MLKYLQLFVDIHSLCWNTFDNMLTYTCYFKNTFDVALYLLKRHSGIVWGPGRFAGLLRGGDVRRLGNPAGAPALGLTPWRTWGCPTNCKIPMSKV